MIVKHCSREIPIKIEKFDEVFEVIVEAGEPIKEEDDGDDTFLRRYAVEKVSHVKLDIDIPAINEMCTKFLIQEEKYYLDSIKCTFEKAWDEISLGQRIMGDYMKFCETKKEFSPEYYEVGNRQFR